MQQAYRSLRIVSEAQTIRIVLAIQPGVLMLKELSTACATLDTESSNGVKAVVLDFVESASSGSEGEARSQEVVDGACTAVHRVAQPVLAVVRGTLSEAACTLIRAADLTLVADDAVLTVPDAVSGNDTLTGAQAARLGHVTWSVPTQNVNKEMERVLGMLRGKSAVALRYAKASVRLGQADHATKLEALGRVNTFYLTQVMQSADAHEGLRAFLEKRQPEWKNA
jgi:enoyl-CoA hydratase/carnithine racemase